MRVFVAGGSGVLGRRLVPQLAARGHQVTATTTSNGQAGPAGPAWRGRRRHGRARCGLGRRGGGHRARPDAIVNQMTGLSEPHAGKPRPGGIPHRFFAVTNRLRTDGTDHLLAAAAATGVTRFLAQSAAYLQRNPTKADR